jgi:beta-lactamase class A
MVIFGKKQEDEEYEEEEKRPLRRRPKSKEFKDLKSEHKRKRKEPPKSWGKKERVLLFGIILATVGTSAVLALSAREWKLPGIPRFKAPSVSIPFLGEETIVIEGRKEDQKKADEIISIFNEKTKDLSGVYGLYVVNLENGYSFGLAENETFQAASLIKLPVMAAMFLEAEEGNLELETKYQLKSEDKVPGAGSLYGKPVGHEITYRNLVRLMGKQSDNTAFNIARNLLGEEKVLDVINKIGMGNTSLNENESTPSDIGVFFEELWNGNIVDSKNKEELLDYLTDTVYESWITAGLPDGTRFAHKFGRETHVVNDAGIVYADKPFVIVIMSKGVVEREADEIIPELAREIYNIYLSVEAASSKS